jgi:CRISPR-associated protein Csm4
MEAIRIKLKFNTPIHLSRNPHQGEQTRDWIGSDTLFSALFSCGIQLGADPEELYAEMASSRFSSAFPFAGDTLYFPRPFCRIPPIQGMESDPKSGKKIKKIQYLDFDYFQKLLSGNLKYIVPQDLSDSGKFISSSRNFPQLVKATHSRVQLDAETHESVPFSLENIHLTDDSGLYFLVQVENGGLPDIIYSALRLLSDQGIGADRHVGYGKFEVQEIKPFSFNLPPSEYYVTLGTVFPDDRISMEMDCPHSGCSWKLKLSEGYISTPGSEAFLGLQRKNMLMLTEGAVIYSKGQTPCGLIQDLKPDDPSGLHPVWRDGRGFWLPIQILET